MDNTYFVEQKNGFYYVNTDNLESFSYYNFSVGDYTLDDCVLVRTTDVFPFNGIVQTPVHGNAFVRSDNEILSFPILNVLREKYDSDDLISEYNKYKLVLKNFRPTIHFTINGLVSSHLLGDFSGRPYIVFDPLKYHVDNSSLESLAVHDTFFSDDLYLSDEAFLIIDEKTYDEIKDNYDYMDVLSKYKIFVYNGKNQEEVVRIVLNYMGYVGFTVDNLNYCKTGNEEEDLCSEKMCDFLSMIREQYNINSISHLGSIFDGVENMNLHNEAILIQLEHLHYIMDNSFISDELREKINKIEAKGFFNQNNVDEFNMFSLSDMYINNEYGIRDVMVEFVDFVGLERLASLTEEFNNRYMEKNIKNNIVDREISR